MSLKRYGIEKLKYFTSHMPTISALSHLEKYSSLACSPQSHCLSCIFPLSLSLSLSLMYLHSLSFSLSYLGTRSICRQWYVVVFMKRQKSRQFFLDNVQTCLTIGQICLLKSSMGELQLIKLQKNQNRHYSLDTETPKHLKKLHRCSYLPEYKFKSAETLFSSLLFNFRKPHSHSWRPFFFLRYELCWTERQCDQIWRNFSTLANIFKKLAFCSSVSLIFSII